MEADRRILSPEDYAEPRCLLCDEPYGKPAAKPIPQQRVIEKMDEYMARRDYAGAERHLLYWLEEAKLGGDGRGEILVRNELIGHYRKTGEKEKGLQSVEEAMRLLKQLDFENTLSAGTSYVNSATFFNSIGENEKALGYFEKAKALYESAANTRPELLGGLYNNMALVLTALGRFGEAHALYDRAMETMKKVPGGALEQAITCLNRADAIAAQKGMEAGESEIFDLLDQALALLFSPEVPQNGYCAFVYEKCAPTFSYYGYFADAEKLKKRAEELYAGA